MRVYLSGSFDNLGNMRAVGESLRSRGHYVTSNWLDEPPIHVADDKVREDWEYRARANDDKADIDRADVFVVYTAVPSSSGGLHWETGYAEGVGLPTIIVGPMLNVFHRLADVRQFDNTGELLDYLDTMEALR